MSDRVGNRDVSHTRPTWRVVRPTWCVRWSTARFRWHGVVVLPTARWEPMSSGASQIGPVYG